MTLPPLFSFHFPSFCQDFFQDQIEVYWYHRDFTQSRYPPGQETSEACTLICLLVAQRIGATKLIIQNLRCCPRLNILIAESIIEGNARHAQIVRNKLTPHSCLSTDEALKFGGKSLETLTEWKFQVFRKNIKITLYHNINSFLNEWYEKPKALTLFMLFLTCRRTVLFIFQDETRKVTLFDSHDHSTPCNPNRGLVIAQATIEKLQNLCDWYIEAVMCHYSNAQADLYELAFLYEKSGYCNCNRNFSCKCGCLNNIYSRYSS